MYFIKNNAPRPLRKGVCLALASLTLILTMGSLSPAYTQDRYDRHDRYGREDARRWEHERYLRGRQIEWREHERNARRWRQEHRRHHEPEVIYAPPPVYYAPPEPSPGINIVIPLHFR